MTKTLASPMQTQTGVDETRKWLRTHSAASLADFILSLAQNEGTVGDQVRTFIVGDDVPEMVAACLEQIARLELTTAYARRHAHGQQIAGSLELILDSIERLLLPVDCAAAFEMLAALFEADAIAMENCGDHDWEVSCAYQRATDLIGTAAQPLQREIVADKIRELIANDGYGVRAALEPLLAPAEHP